MKLFNSIKLKYFVSFFFCIIRATFGYCVGIQKNRQVVWSIRYSSAYLSLLLLFFFNSSDFFDEDWLMYDEFCILMFTCKMQHFAPWPGSVKK